ncbi:MAG: HAD family phosphatase [Methanothrix sp.]|nr:HAD family phosphatase [Methanothrix sp.]
MVYLITTIIFDAEGIIVDTEVVWDKAQEEFLRRRGLVYQREKLKPLITGKSQLEGIKVMMDECGISGDLRTLSIERSNIMRTLLESEVNYIRGFQEFFDQIEKDYKTCIASSMDPSLLMIIDKRLDLTKLFEDRIYTIRDANCASKPDPCIFLYAAKKLNSFPDECVVIEDSPYGIEAARRAGMKCIAITTTYNIELLVGADTIVNSFDEIDPGTFS